MTIEGNVKNLLVGLLLGIALMLALGAAADSERYDTSVACNDIWAVIVRIDTQTGEITARREAVNRVSPAPHICMPAAK